MNVLEIRVCGYKSFILLTYQEDIDFASVSGQTT